MADFVVLIMDVLKMRIATFGSVDISLGFIAGGYLVYQVAVFYFDYVVRHPSNHGLDNTARSQGFRDHAEHDEFNSYLGGEGGR